MLYKYGPTPDVGLIDIDPSAETTEETSVAIISTVLNSQA